ncbi:MAG: aminoacyl-tRNA deacylase [Planctomycetota bacterium]|jgi:Ala-tRNA(Pro) deacylase
MPVEKLREFLDSHHVKYVLIDHSQAYTAQEIAASAHIPGKELAKTVMVKVDGEMGMAVLPSSYKVDIVSLRVALGVESVVLADEKEFGPLFPDCDLGAMPPFGNLYGIKVYVAESLAEDAEIAFNACSHTQLIRMSYADFEKLVQPVVLKFSTKF